MATRRTWVKMVPTSSNLLVPASQYTGPGDIVSGATVWYGLRAYKLASIGSNAVRLRESGGNTEQNFATIAGGGLDLAAIATFKGANNLFVVTLYDQSGNANGNITQATAGNQPAFTLSGIGGLPVITFSSTQFLAVNASFSDLAQPYSISATYNSNTLSAAGAIFVGDFVSDAAGLFSHGNGGTNQAGLYVGGFGNSVTAADGVWHAVGGMADNVAHSTTKVSVDGTTSNLSDTGNYTFAHNQVILGTDSFSDQFAGKIVEAGLWPSDISSSFSALSTNQHSYWGF